VNLWNAFKRLTQNFSPIEKSQLYSETAKRVYRLK
jgi:L-fuconolactonase